MKRDGKDSAVTRIIDASVAIKWFVDEDGREPALELLREIQSAPQEFVVPDLFYIEMMSVLSRLVPSAEVLAGIIRDLYDLGFVQMRAGGDLMTQAGEIAMRYRVSGYDALYAASALSLGGVWITCDRKAYAKVAELGIARLL